MREKPLILIVDDETVFLEILSKKLGNVGFDAVTARNGRMAIEVAQKLHPDLILMDIHMPPGPSGTDAALEIKAHPEAKDIKIAFLSSLKDPWPATAIDRDTVAKGLGIDDFIEKTEDWDAIVAKVKEILARN